MLDMRILQCIVACSCVNTWSGLFKKKVACFIRALLIFFLQAHFALSRYVCSFYAAFSLTPVVRHGNRRTSVTYLHFFKLLSCDILNDIRYFSTSQQFFLYLL